MQLCIHDFSSVDSNSLFGEYRKVITCDEIFEVIKSAHEKSTAHSGLKKTFDYVSDHIKLKAVS